MKQGPDFSILNSVLPQTTAVGSLISNFAATLDRQQKERAQNQQFANEAQKNATEAYKAQAGAQQGQQQLGIAQQLANQQGANEQGQLANTAQANTIQQQIANQQGANEQGKLAQGQQQLGISQQIANQQGQEVQGKLSQGQQQVNQQGELGQAQIGELQAQAQERQVKQQMAMQQYQDFSNAKTQEEFMHALAVHMPGEVPKALEAQATIKNLGLDAIHKNLENQKDTQAQANLEAGGLASKSIYSIQDYQNQIADKVQSGEIPQAMGQALVKNHEILIANELSKVYVDKGLPDPGFQDLAGPALTGLLARVASTNDQFLASKVGESPQAISLYQNSLDNYQKGANRIVGAKSESGKVYHAPGTPDANAVLANKKPENSISIESIKNGSWQ